MTVVKFMEPPTAFEEIRRRLERNLSQAVEDALTSELSYSAAEYVRNLYDALPGAGHAMPCCGRPVWTHSGSAFEWCARARTMACGRCGAVYRPGKSGEA